MMFCPAAWRRETAAQKAAVTASATLVALGRMVRGHAFECSRGHDKAVAVVSQAVGRGEKTSDGLPE